MPGALRLFAGAALVVSVTSHLSGVASTTHASAGSQPTIAGDWGHFHHDAANTGFNPSEHILNRDNVSRLSARWRVPTAPGAAPTPVVAGGMVFVTPADGVVRALGGTTGAVLWSFAMNASASGAAPTVTDGVLYVGDLGGDLYALDVSSGAQVWMVDLGEAIEVSPTVVGGVLYAFAYVDSDSVVFAVNVADGGVIWSRSIMVESVLAVGQGLVYLSTGFSCFVHALDASTGVPRWAFDVCGEISEAGPPAFADGTVFVNLAGGLYAIDARTGRARWQQSMNGGVAHAAPAIAHDVVFDCSSTVLTAFDEETGRALWSRRVVAREASPAVANGVVYIATRGRLRAFDAMTGASLWASDRATSFPEASPAVSDGVLYAGADDGTVVAFSLDGA